MTSAASVQTPVTSKAVHDGLALDDRPHVLLVIDQIRQIGGAERMIIEIARRLPADRFRCSLLTFDIDPTLDLLDGLPCPLHVLSLRRTFDLHALGMALQLRRLVRRERVSIVHTFFETSDLWAAPIAKLSGCPVLISSRRDLGILRTRKHKLFYPYANRLFDRVLAVSNEVRDFCISEDRLSLERVQTLYNGVDLEDLDGKAKEFDARLEFGIAESVPVICALANIRRLKGIDVLVHAAARVCKNWPQAVFLVVGKPLESDVYADLQRLVTSLNLNANFRFVGAFANPYPILRASNIFCLPSRSEGFSNSLLEAMSCRVPCIATRVGGNAEAIEEGKSGFLVNSEDHDFMADRILLLLADAERAKLMGETARRNVEARFSMQLMISQLTRIYDGLLAAKHA